MMPVNIVTRADELTTADGRTVQDHLDDAGGGFDPDTPLDYFTMRDGTGGIWTVEVDTAGAWVTTAVPTFGTEAGDLLTTEDGGALVVEVATLATESGTAIVTEAGSTLETE